MPRLAIVPHFAGPDRGDGGIRRVVEAQRRWLPELGWDIVESTHEADVVAVHAGNQSDVPASVPLVHHCHGLYWYGYEWERWALKMNRDVIRSMRRADVVTAPSEWVAQTIRRGTQIDPVVLYHGVDLDEFPFHEDDSGYVLWNKTRIDPICDPRPMLELAKRAPNAHFVTTIAWPYESTPDNLEVTGVTSHDAAKQWVRHAAVYLSTARETFGIGILEAMAMGRPVLAWDHGGAREILEHRVSGYLCRVDDIDDQLAGLEWCFEHRAEVGRAARAAVANHFTWPQAMSRYDSLYAALLEAKHAPAPKVSIVMPCHNMAQYIADAIDSVRAQPFSDWELVVIDDASIDDSMAVVASTAGTDPRIRVATNTKNRYLAETLNVGIAMARGHYIMPLDPDNMLGPSALGILVDALDRDRDIDIAYGSMSVIEENGEEWTSEWPKQFEFRRQLIHQNQITSTSLYRRRVWERVGGYRQRCRTAEDADFWCRATSFGANARKVTDAVVLRYRNRSDSMSHVVEDWPWHEWYPWHHDVALTPWLAPVDSERDDPVIPAYENPLVSVVIPVGPGHERLVLDALDSLNAQTFRWWEAVVVNDTGAAIPWLPSWVRLTTTGGSSGAGAARNLGMRSARGKTFIFLDADDWFQPRALEFMVNAWIKAGGGFVYSDWIKAESGETYTAPEWDGCASVLRQLPWPVTCLYGRSVWDAVDGFDPTLSAWEDWDFAIRVVKAGYCGTRVAVPLFHYRINSGSRREAGFADRESLKQEILVRHRALIEGTEEMPCGCQGGGGLPSLPALDLSSHNTGIPTITPQIEGVAPDSMVLLEFTDQVGTPLTFTGRVTGTRYHFGSDDDNKVRWVYRTDAEHLLTREEFRVYNQIDDGARLVAAGPPR